MAALSAKQIEEGRLIRVKTQKCTTRLGRVVGGCQVRVRGRSMGRSVSRHLQVAFALMRILGS